MKVPISWLAAHLDSTASVAEIAERLTMIGLEVEAVTDRAADLQSFIVARVISAEKHPNADRLKLCVVDTGAAEIQVVCGAPNARAGMKGVFAPSGATIPANGMKLKKTKIRGVESNGMLCSARELGIGEDHQGIIELADDAEIGAPAAPALGIDEPVIEIAITPNRGDCLGMRGVARDLAAAGIGGLRPESAEAVAGTFDAGVAVNLDFPVGREDACPMFVGRHIRGLSSGESPDWLKRRLESIGLRPISALVDITNFLTFDLARPLHVFDAAKLSGGLEVRLARSGEKVAALDGQDYELDPEVTVIADKNGALSLGGVIGGRSTGCGEATTEVFIEAALFDPVRTAATGRRLGIDSDARYRFERGVDPAAVISGMETATRLILELCGGEASHLVVAGAAPDWRRDIDFRPDRVRRLGGVDIDAAASTRILESLGFTVSGDGETRIVAVPSWRPDIDGEADLVEEVLRIRGYDQIPVVALPRVAALPGPARDPGQRRAAFMRRQLAARGMVEAVTWSFTEGDLAERFGGGDESLRLANPINADLDVMRPSALPNLLLAAARNGHRGFADLALFELGPAYRDDTATGQELVGAGLRVGDAGPRHWAAPLRTVDAFDAKADALAALAALGAPVGSLQLVGEAPGWYHPGQSGVLRLGPKAVLAHFGTVHPEILRRVEIEGPAVAFEVFLDRLPAPKARSGRTRPALAPSPFQAVTRDFAFRVDEAVPANTILAAATGAAVLISDATIFDVYRGEGVGDGEKSVAIAVTMQPVEATLTEAVIDAVAEKVVAAVIAATGGMLRG